MAQGRVPSPGVSAANPWESTQGIAALTPGLLMFLARAEFDDELLVQLFVFVQAGINVATARDALEHAFGRLGAGDFQEIRDRLDVSLLIQPNRQHALGAILDCDLVALFDDQARNVAMLAIQHDMTVGH